jgi:hypothetical protein
MNLIDAFWRSRQAINTADYAKAVEDFEVMLAEAQKLLPKPKEERQYPSYSIKGGQAGLFAEGAPMGESDQVCVRKAYLRCWGVEEVPSAQMLFTWATGRAQEDVYTQLYQGWRFNVRQEECPEIEGIPIRIEVDAIDPQGEFFELKSVQKVSKLKPFLVTGEYKRENLVQLAYAMATFQQQRGTLRYTSAVWHDFTVDKEKKVFKQGDFRDYKVRFDDSGRFYVDDKAVFLTLDSIYRHIEFSAWVFGNNPKIRDVPRPKNYSDTKPLKDGSLPIACMWCCMKDACRSAEECNCSMNDFVALAKELPHVGRRLR